LVQALALMRRQRPVLLFVGAATAVAVLLGAGAYGLPHLHAEDCREQAARYLEKHPVQGRGFDQKLVSAKPSDVWVYTSGPMTSVAAYSVPADLHVVRYVHECKSGLTSVSLGPRKRLHML
jgi:hypothetical protein